MFNFIFRGIIIDFGGVKMIMICFVVVILPP